jgi:DHA1 family tetracycline resistance protein-like MFS transporter
LRGHLKKDPVMQRRRLVNIFLVVFIDLLGFGLILPLLPYYAEAFGAGAALVGLLVAVYALAQFFAAPFLGRLSDRYGRRPILLVTILGTSLSFLLLGLAEPIGRWLADLFNATSPNTAILLVMFGSRFLAGLFGGNLTVAQAYITDVTDPSNRAKGLGLLGAAFGLGFILGPAIGGILSQWGYAVPAFAAAILALLNFIGVFLFLPESLSDRHRAQARQDPQQRPLISIRAMSDALHTAYVGPILHVRLFSSLAAALFQTMFTLWAKDRLGLDAQQTAYILAYVGLLSVIVQGGIIGQLTKRYSEHQLILWSLIIQAPALLVWAFTPSVPILLIVLIPLAFATGVLNTVLNSALTRVVRPEEIGGALGISASLESISRIVSPALGGWLLGAVGTWAPGVLAALIMALESRYAARTLMRQPDASLTPATETGADALGPRS